MISCWDGDPSKRPTFSELRSRFDKILQSNAKYIRLLPVNIDSPCYNPENAPEGMTISVSPTQPFLSPNVARKGISLDAYRDPTVNEATLSIKSGIASGEASGCSSPGLLSPRRLSPTADSHKSASSTSLPFTDANRDVHKSRGANLYVRDPSQLGTAAQVRPSSMLISCSPASESSHSQNGSGNQDGESHRRSNSVIVSLQSEHTASSGSKPGNVNVPGDGTTNESVCMTALNPSFGLSSDEGGKGTVQESEVPDIQIDTCF